MRWANKMSQVKSLCVFCGSSFGKQELYRDKAVAVGKAIAARGFRLVYGGGNVGLMGAVADAAMAEGGEVIGVIPERLQELEVGHAGLSELHVVNSMHERKALMADLSDGFINLPGGIGTLEEMFEVWTWGQLGYHEKPIGLLNTNGFYDPLLAFIDHQVSEGFLRQENRDMVLVDTDPDGLIDRMLAYQPLHVQKWIEKRSET